MLQILSAALGLGIWYAFSAKSSAFPDPKAVVVRAGQLLTERTNSGAPILLAAAWASLRRVFLGFVIGTGAAIPIGFLMGWYAWARGLLEPWLQFFRMVPALALIPLVLVLLGIGEDAKIFVIAVSAFLMSVIATYQGVISVDRTLIDAARVLGASDGTIFRRVVIPASSPFILVGMRVGLGSSWGTLIAAELIAAQQGLGYQMSTAELYGQTDTIVVVIITIGILGLAMDRILLVIERKVGAWQERRAQ
jgi:NitT/TauT family transport system permease protein